MAKKTREARPWFGQLVGKSWAHKRKQVDFEFPKYNTQQSEEEETGISFQTKNFYNVL